MAKENLKENQTPGMDITGGGTQFVEPVAGDTPPYRPADNPSDTDADTIAVPGVGEVSRMQRLGAFVQKIAALPPEVLDRIIDAASTVEDVNATGVAPGPADAAGNAATIMAKESVNELFAGEELTEEFKIKAAVLFEANVNTAVALKEAELTEQNEERVKTLVAEVTENLVEKLDLYLTHAAERFMEQNQQVFNATAQSVMAEQFLAKVVGLARECNVTIPEIEVNVLENIQVELNTIKEQLNEQLESNIQLTNENKAYKRKETFDNLSESLTVSQKEKLKALSESVTFEDDIDYAAKLTILKESVTAKVETPKVLVEQDGVPVLGEDKPNAPVIDPLTQGIMTALGKIK